jgi:hypothetical protein
MTRGFQGTAIALVVALLLGGPLAPLAAAQQAQPVPPLEQAQPGPTVEETAPATTAPAETAPAPAPEPAPLAGQAPVSPAPVTESAPVTAQAPPPPAGQPDLFKEKVKRRPERGADGYDAGAVVVNVFRPPFKALLCGLGGVAGAGIFVITLGTAYRGAAAAVAEGCGGKWIVSGDDLRPENSHEGFEWESRNLTWDK